MLLQICPVVELLQTMKIESVLKWICVLIFFESASANEVVNPWSNSRECCKLWWYSPLEWNEYSPLECIERQLKLSSPPEDSEIQSATPLEAAEFSKFRM